MGTHHKGTAREKRALDAYIKLSRASDSLTAVLQRGLAGTQLTLSQFGVLEALYHLGPMCQRAIGGKLLKSGGNITTVVDNLERRGLVTRVRDTRDRRFITLHLTPAGRKLIEKIFPRHLEQIVGAFENLSADEQDELGRISRKLGTAVQTGPSAVHAGDA